LVLLRLQSGRTRRLLAEVDESPQPKSELGQGLVFGTRDVSVQNAPLRNSYRITIYFSRCGRGTQAILPGSSLAGCALVAPLLHWS
jgi:hypothetical protein